MARPHRRTDAEPIDRLLHALGDPTRRRIVELLATRPHAVSALAELCGITVTAVGQHIQLLEAGGLVTSSKLGRVRSCQLDSKGLNPLKQWVAARQSVWENRLDALGNVLASSDEGAR